MGKRNNIPPNIRIYFSKLRKLINQKRFIKGTLYYLRNTCGKANCKCARGEKHISLYIQQVKNKKARKSIIPKSKWDEVRKMNNQYKEILELLGKISDYEWEHLKDRK
jgi:hypothetical protein